MYSELQSTSDELRIVGNLQEYADFYGGVHIDTYKYAMDLLMQHWKKGRNAHFLEIGAGAGYTVDLLHSYFTKLSLVEPNPYLREQWDEKSWFNDNKHVLCIYPNTIQELIQSKSIPRESIDVIVLYHCVYHFEIETLQHTMNQILSWLKEDGVCFITVLDDDNEFIQTIFKTVSPNYALSGLIENILHQTNGFGGHYLKYREFIALETTANQYLSALKWMTMQSCLNQNYCRDGLSENQLRELHTQCMQYIERKINHSEDGIDNSETLDDETHTERDVLLKNELKNIHFIFKKRTVSTDSIKSNKNDKLYNLMAGFIGLLVIFAIWYWSTV
eukprot:14847_1